MSKSQPNPVPVKLTNEQKRRLSWMLLANAAQLIDSWSEYASEYECDDVDAATAAQLFANWLQYMPHDSWPTSLPEPVSSRL